MPLACAGKAWIDLGCEQVETLVCNSPSRCRQTQRLGGSRAASAGRLAGQKREHPIGVAHSFLRGARRSPNGGAYDSSPDPALLAVSPRCGDPRPPAGGRHDQSGRYQALDIRPAPATLSQEQAECQHELGDLPAARFHAAPALQLFAHRTADITDGERRHSVASRRKPPRWPGPTSELAAEVASQSTCPSSLPSPANWPADVPPVQ